MKVPRKLRLPSRRSLRLGVTATDQCVSSLSNFAVGVVVARIAGVAGFGAYALVYAVWLVLGAFHRSLITDLMSIENDLHKPDAEHHVRVGLSAELWMGIVAAGLFIATGLVLDLTGNQQFGTCFLIIGPFLPFLLAQDYWRWIGFMKARPETSLANDMVFLVVQFATFGILLIAGVHSLGLAIMAWGLGAMTGAAYGCFQHSTTPTLREGRGRIQSRWKISRWLVGVDILSSTRSQVTLFMTGAFLGPVGLGGFKAAGNLVAGPSLVLIQAGGSIGLPESSKAMKDRGWPGLRRVQRMVTGAGTASVGLVALVVFLFGHTLLVSVYGSAFGRYSGIADILAIGVFLNTLSLGAILSLKVTRQTANLFHVNLVSLVVSVIAVLALAPTFGIVGAAVATAVGSVFNTMGLLWLHFRSSRPAAEMMTETSTPVGNETVVLT